MRTTQTSSDASDARAPSAARGGPTPLGSILRPPAYGPTLRLLAGDGAAALYRGEIAARIAEDFQAHGGFITRADLAGYRATVSAPLESTYRGHRVVAPGHPLLRGVNTRFDVPHSRYNAITRQHFEQAGLTILIESAEAGVHAAVSDDKLRRGYFQGHTEYDAHSLRKEYQPEGPAHVPASRERAPAPPTRTWWLPVASAM